MKKHSFLATAITFLVLAPACCPAQDVHFSQFYEAQLYQNPALSGLYKGDVHVQAMFRQQWTSISSPFETGYLSGEYKVPVGKQNDYLTLGAQFMYDQAGTATLTTTLVEPSLNYSKSLNHNKDMYLSVGFMGGLTQRRIDQSKITTDYQYSNGGGGYSGEVLANPNITYIDGSAGISFTTALGEDNRNHFYAGVSYDHFNRPRSSFYNTATVELQPKWVYSAGIKLFVSEQTFVEFHADHMEQGTYRETMAGGLFSVKFGDLDDPDYVLGLGAFLRWQSDIIPVVRLNYRLFAVSLSYDANISQLETASQGRGGFELGVSFLAFTRLDNSTRNSTLCPVF
jgi:type IX secretion system PorP/SprF family membrane protein